MAATCRYWRALQFTSTRSVHDFYSQCSSPLTLKSFSSISLSCTRKSTRFCSRKWSSLPKSKNSLLLLTSHSRAGSNLLRSKSSFSTGYRRDQGGNHANRRTVIYTVAIAVGVVGLTYAAVPLYRLFCQVDTNDITSQCALCNCCLLMHCKKWKLNLLHKPTH